MPTLTLTPEVARHLIERGAQADALPVDEAARRVLRDIAQELKRLLMEARA